MVNLDNYDAISQKSQIKDLMKTFDIK